MGGPFDSNDNLKATAHAEAADFSDELYSQKSGSGRDAMNHQGATLERVDQADRQVQRWLEGGKQSYDLPEGLRTVVQSTIERSWRDSEASERKHSK